MLFLVFLTVARLGMGRVSIDGRLAISRRIGVNRPEEIGRQGPRMLVALATKLDRLGEGGLKRRVLVARVLLIVVIVVAVSVPAHELRRKFEIGDLKNPILSGLC